MLKRKIDNYIQDFYNNSKNALLITGARQIGKTFSIREFGKRFNSFIEINFIDNPQAIDVFKGAKNSSDILLSNLTISNHYTCDINGCFLAWENVELIRR